MSSKLMTLLLTSVVLVFFCSMGLSIVGDYGITIDEPLHINRTKIYINTWKLLWEGKEFSPNAALQYGPLLNGISSFYQINDNWSDFGNYYRKHVITFLFSLLGYLGLSLAFKKAFKVNYSFLCALFILALVPSYFGHAFYNPKDSPFAATYTLSSALIGIRIAFVLQRFPLNTRQLLVEGLLIGTLIAFNTSIRIAGLAIGAAWVFVLFFLSFTITPRPRFVQRMKQFITIGGLASPMLAFWLVIFYPPLLETAFQWIKGTFAFYSHAAYLDWLCRFIDGYCYKAHNLPYYYIPLYFFMKLPLLHLFFGTAGLLLFFFKWKSQTLMQRSIGLMMFLQLVSLPLFLVILKTPPYDGERHFLFMFPAWAYFAFYGLWDYWHSYRSRIAKVFIAVLVVIMAGWITKNMIDLHPYEHAYMNEPSRFKALDRKWDMDYWRLSDKPITEWLNKHLREGDHVVGSPTIAYKAFGNGKWTYSSKQPKDITKAFYATIFTRSEMVRSFWPWCWVVYRETRMLDNQEISMGTIYHCIPSKKFKIGDK